MSDCIEVFQAMKDHSKNKRASNRENGPKFLTEAGIPFVEKNQGAHLIVEGGDCFIDYWPGTGRWASRSGAKGFGVRNLVQHIVGAKEHQ